MLTEMEKTLGKAPVPNTKISDATKAFHPRNIALRLMRAINTGDGEQEKAQDDLKTIDGIATVFTPSRLPFIRIHKGRIARGFMGVDRAIELLLLPNQLCFVWIVFLLLHYPVNQSTTNRLMERNKPGKGLARTMEVVSDEISPLLIAIVQQLVEQEDLSMFPVTLICGMADGCTDCAGDADLSKVDSGRIAHFEKMYKSRVATLETVVGLGGHVVVKSGEVWKTWTKIMEGKGFKGKAVSQRNFGFGRNKKILHPSMRVVQIEGYYRKNSDGTESKNVHLHQTHPSTPYTPKAVRYLDRINLQVLSQVETLESWYFRTLIPTINAAYGTIEEDRTPLLIALNRPKEKVGITAKIKELLKREMNKSAEDEEE